MLNPAHRAALELTGFKRALRMFTESDLTNDWRGFFIGASSRNTAPHKSA